MFGFQRIGDLAWAGGDMQHHHEIRDIQFSNGRTVVTVVTHGETAIAAALGHKGFLGQGALSQSLEWTFNADSGQLLSLSAEQEGHQPFQSAGTFG